MKLLRASLLGTVFGDEVCYKHNQCEVGCFTNLPPWGGTDARPGSKLPNLVSLSLITRSNLHLAIWSQRKFPPRHSSRNWAKHWLWKFRFSCCQFFQSWKPRLFHHPWLFWHRRRRLAAANFSSNSWARKCKCLSRRLGRRFPDDSIRSGSNWHSSCRRFRWLPDQGHGAVFQKHELDGFENHLHRAQSRRSSLRLRRPKCSKTIRS